MLTLNRLKSIGIGAHGQVVFSLLQDALRYSADWSRLSPSSQIDAYKHRLVFQCYVIGMSLSKLNTHIEEQEEIKKQVTWVWFSHLLEYPLTVEDVEVQHEKPEWSQKNREDFFDILVQGEIKLDHVQKQMFRETPINFDKITALAFHTVISKLLGRIITRRRNLFLKQQGNTEVNLAAGLKQFGESLLELVCDLYLLAQFTHLPGALKFYVDSIKPPRKAPPKSGSPVSDGATTDEIDTDRITSDQAVRDDETGTTADPSPLSNNPANGGIGHAADSNGGCYEVPRWRARYSQWILGILRQSKAVTRLTQITETAHAQRIQNLSFNLIPTDQPSDQMEAWEATVKRVLATPVDHAEKELAAPTVECLQQIYTNIPTNECDRVLKALRGLRDLANINESYKWLNEWSFHGTVHCEATLVCQNIAKSLAAPSDTNKMQTSKIGVSRQCCYVCSLVLEEAHLYSKRFKATMYSGSSTRVWSCTLPKDCPLDMVRTISDKLDGFLRRALLKSIPKLENDWHIRLGMLSDDALSQSSNASGNVYPTWKNELIAFKTAKAVKDQEMDTE